MGQRVSSDGASQPSGMIGKKIYQNQQFFLSNFNNIVPKQATIIYPKKLFMKSQEFGLLSKQATGM